MRVTYFGGFFEVGFYLGVGFVSLCIVNDNYRYLTLILVNGNCHMNEVNEMKN